MVRDLAVGDATHQWANMMNYYTNSRYADEKYAWFFPYGLYGLGEDSGMFMYATNRPNL